MRDENAEELKLSGHMAHDNNLIVADNIGIQFNLGDDEKHNYITGDKDDYDDIVEVKADNNERVVHMVQQLEIFYNLLANQYLSCL